MKSVGFRFFLRSGAIYTLLRLVNMTNAPLGYWLGNIGDPQVHLLKQRRQCLRFLDSTVVCTIALF